MAEAIKAEFCNTKFVLGRKAMQIILEVPIEQASSVHQTLGYPDPHNSRWVAVALLREGAE